MAESYQLQIDFENLFPTNPSLADDLCRLFMTTKLNSSPVARGGCPNLSTCNLKPTTNAFEAPPSPILEEFRRLGRDSEYCPDFISLYQNNTGPGRPVFRKKPKKTSIRIKECVFCKNNGETQDVYANHILKDAETSKIVCPILRAYTCPLCGANGDTAHTVKYCPKNKEINLRASPKPICTMTIIRNAFGRCRLKCT